MSDKLLVAFRTKDTVYGVTRSTLKALSDELDMNETTVVHLALSRLARELLPAYEPDDGPLKPTDLDRLRNAAKARAPKGKVISTKSLF
jgi:hypothetical protein